MIIRRFIPALTEDEATEVRTFVALTIEENLEDLPPKYQEVLKRFTSDTAVLNSLEEWIKERENEKTWYINLLSL